MRCKYNDDDMTALGAGRLPFMADHNRLNVRNDRKWKRNIENGSRK